MKDPSSRRYPEYLNRLSSFEYCASLVASLATTVPILADYFFERFLKFTDQNDGNTKKEEVPIPLRQTIALLIIPDVLILFWIIPFGLYDYLMVLADARDTLYTFSLLVCVIQCRNNVWTRKPLLLIGGPLMINNVILSFSSLSSDEEFLYYSGIVSIVLVSIALAALLVYVVIWFQHFSSLLSNGEATMQSYLCSTYVVLTAIFLLGDWVPRFVPTEPGDAWSSVGLSYLTCYSYMMASCTLCLTVISSRCAAVDATRVGYIHTNTIITTTNTSTLSKLTALATTSSTHYHYHYNNYHLTTTTTTTTNTTNTTTNYYHFHYHHYYNYYNNDN